MGAGMDGGGVKGLLSTVACYGVRPCTVHHRCTMHKLTPHNTLLRLYVFTLTRFNALTFDTNYITGITKTMSRYLLSIIVPFAERDTDSIRRLNNAIACFAHQPTIEVVLVDAGRRSVLTKLTNTDQVNLRYSHCYQRGVFSPGSVRNFAAQQATGDYLFLMDADLLISQHTITTLFSCIASLQTQAPQAFCMFPCLYLSQAYSAIAATQQDYQPLLAAYLSGKVNKVEGIALASSCLLIKRQWFLGIGGFRTEFSGYGCEDLELIHRLVSFYPLAAKPNDYPVDFKTPFPADYCGFRRYFSVYAVPHLFKGDFLLHQFHPRPHIDKYHRMRKQNEVIFAELLQAQHLTLPPPLSGFEAQADFVAALNQGEVLSTVALPNFAEWLQAQQIAHGFALENYTGLFCFQGGSKKRHDSLQRKLRKLLLNPMAFFRDSKLGRRMLRKNAKD